MNSKNKTRKEIMDGLKLMTKYHDSVKDVAKVLNVSQGSIFAWKKGNVPGPTNFRNVLSIIRDFMEKHGNGVEEEAPEDVKVDENPAIMPAVRMLQAKKHYYNQMASQVQNAIDILMKLEKEVCREK